MPSKTPAHDYAEERGFRLSEKSIEEQLAEANGNRRTRTLELSEVMELVEEVSDDCPFILEDAGRVANSYKYRATTTSVLLWKMGPFVMGVVREVGAKGGTGFGDLIRKDKREPGGYRILDIEAIVACSAFVH